MIYIIFDESYEWDDYMYNGEKIVYCGTDKEEAECIFNKYYGDVPSKPVDKWCYKYSLWEFPDGYNYYVTPNVEHLIMDVTNEKFD